MTDSRLLSSTQGLSLYSGIKLGAASVLLHTKSSVDQFLLLEGEAMVLPYL
jgi:hypothetical protein